MAKKTTGKSDSKPRSSGSGASRAKPGGKSGTAVARTPQRARSGGDEKFNAGEAFINLLQSPLVAELIAVAATAALAALAEQGFASSSSSTRGKRAGQAVKAAGKAAAAAVGRRLGTEIDEIRKAAKTSEAK